MFPPRNIIMIKDLCIFISQQYARERNIYATRKENNVSIFVVATYEH